ncbi:MAG: ATP synthase subunit I [Thiotrichales bacterium]|nr:ATP synthase subunit I [Thiotrichales bacterium]
MAQLAVAVVIALVLWVLLDPRSAWSALLGGGIWCLASWFMARIMFAREDASPKQMLLAFYIGEAVKIVMTVVCFVIAFVLLDLNALAFILTYIAMLLVHWLALLKFDYS